MVYYIIGVLSILFLGVVSRNRTGRILYLRKFFLPAVCIVFILCLIIFSKSSFEAASKGIHLWLHIVLPSLFPFFVASELLSKTGFVRTAGVLLEPVMRPLFNVPGCGSFAFAMGVCSGYPVGATITCDLRKDKLISRVEAERLLAFCNNSGPLFIIGAVSVGMFRRPDLGLFMLLCHFLACVTVGILFRFYKRKESISHLSNNKTPLLKRLRAEIKLNQQMYKSNFGEIFGDAVKNSMSILLAIGGFIILFSVIIHLFLDTGIITGIVEIFAPILSISNVGKDSFSALLCGIFEITTGTNKASTASGVSLAQQLTVASAIIGWAGLSVHAQVISIVSKTDIRIRQYLLGKLLQGIFAGIYTFIGLKLFGGIMLKSVPVFVHVKDVNNINWQDSLIVSFQFMVFGFISLIIIFIISTLIQLFRLQKA